MHENELEAIKLPRAMTNVVATLLPKTSAEARRERVTTRLQGHGTDAIRGRGFRDPFSLHRTLNQPCFASKGNHTHHT